MSLSSKEIDHLCLLARLAPSDELRQRFAGQCADIVNYMQSLSTADTEGVEPWYSPASHTAPLREDVAQHSLQKPELFANAPDTNGDFFLVPRIVEGK